MKRVVITGMGAVTPIGNDLETLWFNLLRGECGIDTIQRFDASRLAVSIDAEVKDFNARDYYKSVPELHKSDLFMQYAMAASMQAVNDSKILESDLDKERFGVYIGSGIGGINTFYNESQKLFEKGPERVSPFFIPMLIGNMAAGAVAIRFGAKGPVLPIMTACATSTHTIGEAFHAIKAGYADAIIAGGAEASINEIGMAGFVNCKTLSLAERPDEGCVPFDARRQGFVMGEGAGMVILEEYEHAKRRNAKIYAEVIGYGNTCDAYHVTSPDPEAGGTIRAMQLALKEGQIGIDETMYVNAHGTGTKLNDSMETRALKEVFGQYAKKLHISSTKSMTGHMLGATGAVEIIACAKALQEGMIPPTIHLEQPDPECDLDYTPNIARKLDFEVAISNSLGFGGHNACVALRRS